GTLGRAGLDHRSSHERRRLGAAFVAALHCWTKSTSSAIEGKEDLERYPTCRTECLRKIPVSINFDRKPSALAENRSCDNVPCSLAFPRNPSQCGNTRGGSAPRPKFGPEIGRARQGRRCQGYYGSH